MAHPFWIYDTLRRSIVPYSPRIPGHVGLYVCGMTVYDHAHVGHARAMVVFDALVRYLRHRGWRVTYVRNHTDIDDKIIARARASGEDPLERAQRFIDALDEDTRALGLLTPDFEPRVTESMPAIVAMIDTLIAKEHAYVASNGDVFFAVLTCDRYGVLSNRKGQIEPSADIDTGKRDMRDFALWKSARPGEPSWPSPWGQGRPGWHIECSAMAHETLGDALDIHGGGIDLVFPHHENEIAQSECVYHDAYAGYWMHNGLLTTAGGAKIARSEGNGATIREVLRNVPAEALRFAHLRAHYRTPLRWDEQTIDDALAQLSRIYAAFEMANEMRGEGDSDRLAKDLGADARTVLELARAFGDRVYSALDSDFDTPRALMHTLELARAVQRFGRDARAIRKGGPIARIALEALSILSDALGLFGATPEAHDREMRQKTLPRLGLDEASVEARIAARNEARRIRAFEKADAIRAELAAQGIEIRDGAEKTTWRVRV